jgi:hypothetical protein
VPRQLTGSVVREVEVVVSDTINLGTYIGCTNESTVGSVQRLCSSASHMICSYMVIHVHFVW